MNVLILSMTVGQGHNSASYALEEVLTKKGHECTVLDTYKYLNKAVGLAFDKGYTYMGRFLPKLNENIYGSAEKYSGRADMKMYFPWLFADFNKAKMQKYIEKKKPDVIVCTIVMTAMLVSILKESGMLDTKIKTFGIVTDYSLHPFWEFTDIDYFVCANELMIDEMVERGIPEEKILPTGIPIKEKFAQSTPVNEARNNLGLDEELFTVLITAGGMGFSGMPDMVKMLDTLDGLQIVAVCGTNKRLHTKIKNSNYRNTVKPLEYIKNMDEYMDACDIVVTKPGGLSTSEAIAKAKPILLMPPMPGVENMNHAFLINNSLAVHTNQYSPAHRTISHMRTNDQKLQEMKNAQVRWGKKDSAAKLCEFIEGCVEVNMESGGNG